MTTLTADDLIASVDTGTENEEHYKETIYNLLVARAQIEDEEGWTKGDFYAQRPQGGGYCFCAIGALYYTPRESGVVRTYLDLSVEGSAVRALTKALPPGYPSVPMFNDDPLTTHADVLALYDRAIAYETELWRNDTPLSEVLP